MNKYQQHVKEKGQLPSSANPGGYPIYYVFNGTAYCSECATLVPDVIEAHDIHWEGAPITCDNCEKEIESAYGEVEA